MTDLNLQRAGIATESRMDLYVRAIDGDDSNDGTEENPLATLQAAVDLVPYIVRHAVVIHVGAHTGNGYLIPSFKERIIHENIYVYGDGAGVGDGFTELVSSTAALAGSDANKVLSSGLSTSEFAGLGEFYGATIEILSGNAEGDRRTIGRNEEDAYIPMNPFSANITNGELYRIVTPAVVLKGGDEDNNYIWLAQKVGQGASPYGSVAGKKIYFINFATYGVGGYPGPTHYIRAYVDQSAVAFLGFEVGRYFSASGNGSTIFSGCDGGYDGLSDSLVTDLGVTSASSWFGWCVSSRWDFRDSEFSLSGDSAFYGGLCVGEVNPSDCYFKLWWASIQGNGIRAYGRTRMIVLGWLATKNIIGTARAARGIRCRDNTELTIASYIEDSLQIQGTTALGCDERGWIKITNSVANGTKLIGARGMRVQGGARLDFNTPEPLVFDVSQAEILLGDAKYLAADFDVGDYVFDADSGRVRRTG